VKRGGTFHGEESESLEQVVLADVSNHSELVEVASSSFGSESLGVEEMEEGETRSDQFPSSFSPG